MKDPGTASVVAGVFLRCNVFGRNYRWAAGKKNVHARDCAVS